MPLQNRVNPFGELVSIATRGMLMGNRGGRFHRDDQLCGKRRWASDRWICCSLKFKGRHRSVWGESYTELFFLDEPTALAAGHRPCFRCRPEAATAFSKAFAIAAGYSVSPEATDKILHTERLDGKAKRLHRHRIDTLPDGAMIARDGKAFAVRGKKLLPWTPSGYGPSVARPRGKTVDVLTPPSILAMLAAGYTPLWHESADSERH
jgi:hypothetical protein